MCFIYKEGLWVAVASFKPELVQSLTIIYISDKETTESEAGPVSVHTYHFLVETGSCERDCVLTLMSESGCPGRRTWFFRYRHILNKFVKKNNPLSKEERRK